MVEQTPIKTSQKQELSSITQEKQKYRKLVVKRGIFLAICVVLLIVIVGVSLAMGSAGITFTEAYAAIFAKYFPNWFTVSSLADTVVWTLRLPRVLLGLIAGAALAMSGSTTQAILRNPLATPYTLGISSAAGFGAGIGIILGKGFLTGSAMTIVNAFVFSLIPVAVILVFVKRRGASPVMMILAGIAVTYFFSACTTILQYFAEANAVAATVFWAVGDLSRAAWWQLPYILGALIICLVINLRLSRDLNIMKMGDDTAKSLGVEVNRVRTITMVAACLSTATVVSFTGAIGFICLLAPHICRSIIGGDERYLVVASTLFGAVLLLSADLLARQLIAPLVIPVGAITAFIGAPLLLYLLIRKKNFQ
ncbi:MAG: FecCD family ABC transporter permease [Candidatus Bathyarchaeia archaeon]|jgi:iron complex transport system permease protein